MGPILNTFTLQQLPLFSEAHTGSMTYYCRSLLGRQSPFYSAPCKCGMLPPNGYFPKKICLLLGSDSDTGIMDLFQIACSGGCVYRLTYVSVSQTLYCDSWGHIWSRCLTHSLCKSFPSSPRHKQKGSHAVAGVCLDVNHHCVCCL